MRPGTLRGRLAFLALVTTAAWVVLLTLLFNVLLGGRLRADADDLLRTRAEAAASTVQVLPGGTLKIAEPADDSALDTDIWIYQGTRAVERPAGQPWLQRKADTLAGSTTGFTTTGEIRLYTRPISAAGRRAGTVVTAVGLNSYHRMLTSALTGSIVLALLLLLGVYAVTRAVVGRALQPVAEMTGQAADWSGHDLGRRFGTGRRPAELSALAAGLDELLDRLSLVLRHEQQWSAELSHELRTPLSRIVAEADWLSRRPRSAEGHRAALDVIKGAAEEMQRICETLLAEARTRGTRLPGRCALSAMAVDLAARWPTTGPRLTLQTLAEELTAGSPPEIVERLLAPLLDNARRYAATTVVLRVEPGVRIVVHDDGDGVPEAVRDRVFEPGFRAEPADGHPGAGLGLALARRLARSAGGDLTLEGRAAFVVALPPG
ncbi:sensor histidine kinase [Actinomadura opuntiae]|uniref:sensor histidine kinase n=1 Tax=Actinomadura sp. OS1-43 TaxID=604315 RepID=UPI00255B1EB9|nr:ATP-binding protein [Actinomadura sp. OS1-43]MDL4818668.1 histidine kinase dimerization/phospho-acceptor domain-containing protein [Actinomadura sp. OS1-43]